MIARHGLVAPAATVVSGSRARPARRVSAMKNSTGVHVPRRRSRAHLLCVVTGAPRPALASPRGSRVVRSAAAADALAPELAAVFTIAEAQLAWLVPGLNETW